MTSTVKPTKKARYRLTARLEGEWRWVVVHVSEKARKGKVIAEAQKVLQQKHAQVVAEAKEDPNKAIDVQIWESGGITLTNGDGRVIWSRPIAGR
jgi:hypothetical protein